MMVEDRMCKESMRGGKEMLEWGSWMGIGWGCEVLISSLFDDNFEYFIRTNKMSVLMLIVGFCPFIYVKCFCII
jgi:hypothetical protein